MLSTFAPKKSMLLLPPIPKSSKRPNLLLPKFSLKPRLEVGFGAGARGGQTGQAVAVAHQVAALLLPAYRPFRHQFGTGERGDLSGELVLVRVAVAELHVEYRCVGVAVFRRGTRR